MLDFGCCTGAGALKAVYGETAATTKEQAKSAPGISAVPIYNDFFNHPDLYSRIHLHLIGIVGGSKAISHRKNRLGWNRLVDGVADPYVEVEVVGDDLGSTDYFPIAKHTFPVLYDTASPIWDAKTTLLAKKEGIRGLKFRMLDKNRGDDNDELLLEFELAVSDFPEPVTDTIESPGKWASFKSSALPTEGDAEDEPPLELTYHLKIVNGADRIVSEHDNQSLFQDTSELEYSEQIITPPGTLDAGEDNALLQCWKHKESSKSNAAVLWILGRNDCFMHKHVANALFWNSETRGQQKYDLYVLNYSMNGCCRKQGWVTDAHLNSHNKYGNFDIYNDQIASALKTIKESIKTYETVLGYAHSTGGPVFLNYLLTHGDDDFDAFIFNSPFLDWGFVGGDLIEIVLENVNLLEKIGVMTNDKKLGVSVTPGPLKKTPIKYLGQEIVLSAWSAKIWSQYHFDFASRPLYNVPMTGGFARGVSAVHEKIKAAHNSKKAITSKPFLCIASRGDDVLKSNETTSRADWIGPARCEVELNDNCHDVFLSHDVCDSLMAIDMTKSWMKNKGLL
jgi:alpha-beta hydrolase superfamily lysophospholipase